MVLAGLAVCCTGVFTAQTAASSFIGVAAKQNRALAVGLYVTFYYVGGSVGATRSRMDLASGGMAWLRGASDSTVDHADVDRALWVES